MSPRTGRRAGESGTRQAILEAARERFAALGYDAASVRGIARRAGVDAALVHHFFGSKERLFAAAVGFPAAPSEVLRDVAGESGLPDGASLVRALLAVWDDEEAGARFVALVRSAVANDDAMAMLREFLTATVLAAVSARIADGDGRLRASLVAGQILGLALTRHVLRLPAVAAAPPELLAAAVGPTIDRYLGGDLAGG